MENQANNNKTNRKFNQQNFFLQVQRYVTILRSSWPVFSQRSIQFKHSTFRFAIDGAYSEIQVELHITTGETVH